jgi:hypothetical protein
VKCAEWISAEPCVFDGGRVGYLTAYRVEAELRPGQAVELVDPEGSVAHRFACHDGTGCAPWVGEHLDRRARLQPRVITVH